MVLTHLVASVGVVIVVVSDMSQSTAGKNEHAKTQGVELLTHSVECVKWTQGIITSSGCTITNRHAVTVIHTANKI